MEKDTSPSAEIGERYDDDEYASLKQSDLAFKLALIAAPFVLQNMNHYRALEVADALLSSASEFLVEKNLERETDQLNKSTSHNRDTLPGALGVGTLKTAKRYLDEVLTTEAADALWAGSTSGEKVFGPDLVAKMLHARRKRLIDRNRKATDSRKKVGKNYSRKSREPS